MTEKTLSGSANNIASPSHSAKYILVAGDISGIQSFIFNIQSRRASKSLKAKSYFILALANVFLWKCLKESGITETDFEKQTIFNAGGNFLISIPSEKKLEKETLEQFQNNINKELIGEGLQFCLTFIDVTAKNDYNKVLKWLAQESELKKLNVFTNKSDSLYNDFFLPHNKRVKINNEWASYTDSLRSALSFSLKDGGGKFKITESGFELPGVTLTFSNNPSKIDFFSLKDRIHNKMPLFEKRLLKEYPEAFDNYKKDKSGEYMPMNEKAVFAFEMLGLFAKERTGTDKLGVMKLDIDDGARIFQQIDNPEEHKRLSFAIRHFFDEHLCQMYQNDLFENRFIGRKYGYKENIYVVFSGGDDCFLVGAWDAVLQFGIQLRKKFELFSKSLAADDKNFKSVKVPMTFSASYMLVDSKFPVSRFADFAEEKLKQAKRPDKLSGKKDKINLFDYTIDWNFLPEIVKYHDFLNEKIKSNVLSGKIVQLIQDEIPLEQFDNSLVLKDEYNSGRLAKFYYSFRDLKQDQRQEIEKSLIIPYENNIIEAVLNENSMQKAALWPIAARWAEFSTKIKIN